MSDLFSICKRCNNNTFCDKFCTNCGLEVTMFPNREMICPICRITRSFKSPSMINSAEPYSKFCGNCGYNFEGGMA